MRKDNAAICLNRANINVNSRQKDALQSKFAEFAVGQRTAGLAAMQAALADKFAPISGYGFVQKFAPASCRTGSERTELIFATLLKEMREKFR